jgi:hypothetical protein
MFQGSHVVMVSQHGMPSVINVNSFDYPTMVQSGLYTQITETPVSKKDAEEISTEILQDFPDMNE